jgi:intracellular septation protein A
MDARDVVWYAGMAVASAAGLWVAYRVSNGFLALMSALVLIQGGYIYTLERRLEA